MASEARVYSESGCIVRQVTVLDATAIPKGTMLVVSGDRTGVAHSGSDPPIGPPLGYTVEEKEALDGKTEIGVMRVGICEVVADGTVLTGDILALGMTANRLRAVPDGSGTSLSGLKFISGRAIDGATTGNKFMACMTLG